MNRPFDAASATSDNRITLSPEDELAVLRARVDELERESAERKRMDHALKALDRKSTRLNSSHTDISRMPSSA